MSAITTRDGRRLAYRRFGEGPMIVGHPGGPGFESGSLRDLGGLAADFELLLLDPRGTGGSDSPADGAYSLDDYVEDLRELLEHVDGEPRALLGHSHGGLVALLYAARTGRVERLVLVDTPSHVDPETFSRLGSLGSLASGDGEVPKRVEPHGRALAEVWGEAGRSFGDALGDEDVSPEALEYFNEHVIHEFDLRPICADVDVPTLVVCGRQDPAAGPEASAELVRILPDARLAVIESSGHVPYVENPEAFRAAVLDFLAA